MDSSTPNHRYVVGLAVVALSIMLCSIALSAEYMAGLGRHGYANLFWISALTQLALVSYLGVRCIVSGFGSPRAIAISIAGLVISLSSLNALSAPFGLPGADQSFHVGSIMAFSQHQWPFDASIGLFLGTKQVSNYPMIDVLTFESMQVGDIGVFSAGRLIPLALTVMTFVFALCLIRRGQHSLPIQLSFLLVMGCGYISFYFHSWLVSESYGICIVTGILLCATKFRTSSGFGLSMIAVVFIIAVNLSHQISAFWITVLLGGLATARFLRPSISRTIRFAEGRDCGFWRTTKWIVVLFLISTVLFFSLEVYQSGVGLLFQSGRIVEWFFGWQPVPTPSLNPPTGVVTHSIVLPVWLLLSGTYGLFLTVGGFLMMRDRSRRLVFFEWFLPGLAVSGLLLLVSVFVAELDTTRVFVFADITLIGLAFRWKAGKKVAAIAIVLSIAFILSSMSRIPPSSIDSSFVPTESNPALSYLYSRSDYVASDWFSEYSHSIYCDGPMNDLLLGIHQTSTLSDWTLYTGGFDFSSERGMYVFRQSNFNMVQLPAMPQGEFAQMTKELFQSYQNSTFLDRVYDSGSVIGLASVLSN